MPTSGNVIHLTGTSGPANLHRLGIVKSTMMSTIRMGYRPACRVLPRRSHHKWRPHLLHILAHTSLPPITITLAIIMAPGSISFLPRLATGTADIMGDIMEATIGVSGRLQNSGHAFILPRAGL